MVTLTREANRQARGLAAPPRPVVVAPSGRAARAIALASGKGGVGKTNLAVNLGISLVRRGRKVLVFDADLGLANVHVLLGARVERTLWHVAMGRCTLADILWREPSGLWVAPGGCGLAELARLDGFGRGRLLRQLAEIEPCFDFVLVDVAAGVGEQVVQFLRTVGEVMVVTTPEPAALTDAYALVKLTAEEAPGTRFGVVVNAARSTTEGRDAAARLQMTVRRFLGLHLELWGVLPFCGQLPAAVRAQVPVASAYPDSPFAAAVDRLSRRLSALERVGGQQAAPRLSRALHLMLSQPG